MEASEERDNQRENESDRKCQSPDIMRFDDRISKMKIELDGKKFKVSTNTGRIYRILSSTSMVELFHSLLRHACKSFKFINGRI